MDVQPTDMQTQNSETTSLEDGKTQPKSAILPVCMVLALVLGPMLCYAFREEVANWYFAAYRQNLYRGNYHIALEKISTAVEFAPDNLHLRLARVSAVLQTHDAVAAIPDAKLALKTARDMYNKIHDDDTRQQLAVALNQSAYTHALAGQDLEQALKDAQESIMLGGRPDTTDESSMAAEIDTRGYLYYLTGDLEAALEDANQAISESEESYKQDRAMLMNYLKQTAAILEVQFSLRRLDESLAVLYYHRGLVHDALGNKDDAQRDFTKAVKKGYDPDNGVW